MVPAIVDSLREQLTPSRIAITIGILGVWRLGFDASVAQLTTSAVMLVVGTLMEAATDAYDLRDSVRHVGFGAIALVGAVALAVAEGTLWLPAAFALPGGWIFLDAVQTVRHEGATVEEPDGWTVYHDYVGRQIADLLEERPRTRRELGEELDADAEAIDAALAKLREREVVAQTGSQFELRYDDASGLDAVRKRVGSALARIAWPLTVEFTGDSSDTTTCEQGSPAGESEGRGQTDWTESDSEVSDHSLDRDGDRADDHAGELATEDAV